MTEQEPATDVPPSYALERSRVRAFLARCGWFGKLLEVRLRFVLVFVVAFIVVGRWTTLRSYWEHWTGSFLGRSGFTDSVSEGTEFFCPMCPGVLSNWPAICPVCHMDLVPRQRGSAVMLPEGVLARMQLAPYRIQLAGIQTIEVQPQPVGDRGEVLAIPESAVIDLGAQQVVYLETMPGMFDGITVKVGPRVGDLLPVVSGLKPGQRVATSGAFLIDAETRLNPSLAASYFGASNQRTASTNTTKRKAKKGKLSAADLKLVEQQKTCPVTGLDLNSMGGSLPVQLAGQRVFICCAGCEHALKAEPDKHLRKLKRSPVHGEAEKPHD